MIIRPYQEADLARIRASLDAHRSVLYVLPTGGGKTVIAVALALAEAGTVGGVDGTKRGTLFLVHRHELVDQAVSRLLEWGAPVDDVGVIAGNDRRVNPGAPIQVATVQTAALRDLGSFRLVIVDEAHHVITKSYRAVLARTPGAKLLGMTATPERLDRKALRPAFDEMIEGPSIQDLISAGWLGAPRLFGPRAPDLSGVRKSGADFDQRELSKALNKPTLTGDIVEHYVRLAGERRAAVFAVDTEHAKRIVDDFAVAGIPAARIDWETPTDERASILARLRAGEIRVLVNYEILTEGWDMPEVKCVMMARPTYSTALYLQMCGRPLRPWGDEQPLILDHAGNYLRHAPPWIPREWSLDGKTRKSSGAAPCKRCECGAILHVLAATCSECGFVFWIGEPPKEVVGDLFEVARQERCIAPGCEERPKPTAFKASRVMRRNGQPWACRKHGTQRGCGNMQDAWSEQDSCAGYFGFVCEKEPPYGAFHATAKKNRAGEPWRCRSCARKRLHRMGANRVRSAVTVQEGAAS